jgi:hypothetical protein
VTLFVALKAPSGVTVVVAVAVLFAVFESVDEVATVAVVEIVPDALADTVAVRVKDDVPVAKLAFEQFTEPVAPTAGVVQLQPAGVMSEAKLSGAERGTFSVAELALDGPALVTSIV